jgi:ABC-type multidrug transport system ATPase subunit
MQQDCLISRLTVKETLKYSANLRFPEVVTLEERERVIEEVIHELNLKECASTQIGDSANKACSGGRLYHDFYEIWGLTFDHRREAEN